MSGALYIGIDPGLHGANGLIFPDHEEIMGMPVLEIGKGRVRSKRTGQMKDKTDRDYDRAEIVRRIWGWKAYAREKGITIQAFVEKYVPRPKMYRDESTGEMVEIREGKKSTATQARGYEIWITGFAMARIPITEIPAATWKKDLGLSGQDKDASVYRAQQIFPKLVFTGPRGAKLHDRAEAMLIAHYGRQKYGLNF